MIDYKRKRSLGGRITKLWLKTKTRIAIRGIYGDAAVNKFKASQNWVRRFCKRQDITLRRRTNKKCQGLQEKLRFFRNFTPIYIRQLSRKGEETLAMIQYGDAGFQLTIGMLTKFHCHLSMIRRQHMQTRVLHQYGLHNQAVALIKGNLLFSCASDQKVTKLLNLQLFLEGQVQELRRMEDRCMIIVLMFTSRKKHGWIKM